MVTQINGINLEISEDGNIYNLDTKRFINGSPNSAGYIQLSLGGKKFLRSHVVLGAFCPKPDYKDVEIDHIDGNISNDSYDNLRWVTHRENQMNRLPGGKVRKVKLLIDNLNDKELVDVYKYINSKLVQE